MQILGGLVAGFIIERQLTDELDARLSKKGPLGIPTPDGKHFVSAFLVEFFAVVIIHFLRIAVIVDDRGHPVSFKLI